MLFHAYSLTPIGLSASAKMKMTKFRLDDTAIASSKAPETNKAIALIERFLDLPLAINTLDIPQELKSKILK